MHYFTKIELAKLLAYAFETNRRNHALLLSSVCHGLRVSEVLQLRGNDYQGENLVVRRSKGGKNSLQAIYKSKNPVWDESQIPKLVPRPDNLLFPITRQQVDAIIKRYGLACGIPRAKLHAHTLRHTCAHFVYEKSKSLAQVQQVLGHRSPATSLIYLAESQESAGIMSLQDSLQDCAKTELNDQS